MKTIITTLFAFTLMIFSAQSFAEQTQLDPENTLYVDLSAGRVVIKMRPDLAPGHVARIKELTREGYYDGLKWHRVENWVAQTGDPLGNGTGGTNELMDAEFTNEPYKRGTVGMARRSDPNSGDSQWFIVLVDSEFLNGQYTVWGHVVEGMEHIDGLPKGTPPVKPATIVSMKVASDAKEE